MERLNDPSLMPLPHPVRFDAASGTQPDTGLYEHYGIMGTLRPYLTDATASTEWIINHCPGMLDLAMAHFGVMAGQDMGSFILTLTRSRLRAHGDPIIQVTPALQSMLAETDLAEDLPVSLLRGSAPLAFVEFARPNPLRVPNRFTGLHECEGVYIGDYRLPPFYHEILGQSDRVRALGLDTTKPIRAIEIMIIGSPMGKAHALDDASQDLLLLIQDEDESLSAVLDRHIRYYNAPEAYSHPGLTPFSPDEVAMTRPVIFELAKILLYLTLPEAERLEIPERSDLEQRLKKFGKLTAKRRERLASAYDRILIGPRTLPETDAGNADENHRRPRPHWRRGHLRRIRYGEGLAESRLGWIRPVLVNATEAFRAVNGKPSVGQ